MDNLKYFLLGFALWYVIQICDLLMGLLNSFINSIIIRNNQKDQLVIKNEEDEENQEMQQTHAIGFQVPDDDEWYEDDE